MRNMNIASVHMQAIASLVDGDGSIVQINDKKLTITLRVKLKFTDTIMHEANGAASYKM